MSSIMKNSSGFACEVHLDIPKEVDSHPARPIRSLNALLQHLKPMKLGHLVSHEVFYLMRHGVAELMRHKVYEVCLCKMG